MENSKGSLGEVFSQHKVKLSSGQTVVCRGFKVKHMLEVGDILIRNMDTIMKFFTNNTVDVSILGSGYPTFYADMLRLVELSTDIERAEIEEMELDDGVALMGGMMEVNQEFFLQRIRPRLNEFQSVKELGAALSEILRDKDKQKKASDGTTSSPGSLSTGIRGKRSASTH